MWVEGRAHQASDLHKSYRAILDEARSGHARVRDTDGTVVLVIPERRVVTLERLSIAGANLAAAQTAMEKVASGVSVEPQELGDWTWLRVFDADELRQFVADMRRALIIGAREGSTEVLDAELEAWWATARAASDPVYMRIIERGFEEDDFVELGRPELQEPAE